MTNDELVEYYRDLLIIQYNSKPKASGFMRAVLNVIMIYDLIIAVRDGYNIDTAIGNQLDILGKYVGAKRYIPGTVFARDYYGYAAYGETSPFTFFRMKSYSESIENIDWQFRSYAEAGQTQYSLVDTELRNLIKICIAKRNSNASLKDIDDFMYKYFGDDVFIIDNMDATINYYISQTKERIFNIAKGVNAIPTPAGIKTNIYELADVTKEIWYTYLAQKAGGNFTYNDEILTIENLSLSVVSETLILNYT